jgi:ribonuclease HI
MPKWLAKNWRGSNGPVANQDLWKELLAISSQHHVEWHWLRGHAGSVENERVDYLCSVARKELIASTDR